MGHVTSNIRIPTKTRKVRKVNKEAAKTSASTTIEVVSAKRVVVDSTVATTSREEITTAITRSPDPHASSASPVSLASPASPEKTMMPTVARPTPVATGATVVTVVKVVSAVVNVATIIIVTTMASVVTAAKISNRVVAEETVLKSPVNLSTVNSKTRTEMALAVT